MPSGGGINFQNKVIQKKQGMMNRSKEKIQESDLSKDLYTVIQGGLVSNQKLENNFGINDIQQNYDVRRTSFTS